MSRINGHTFAPWARYLTPGFVALCLLVGMMFSPNAMAQRRALLVGSNVAPPGLVPLRYAHSDARKMRDVLVELGGIKPKDAVLLLDPTADTLKAALKSLRSSTSNSEEVIFYYSGHANQKGLHLKGEDLPLGEIRAFLKDESKQVRVAILDSCESGAMTQVKGGTMRPGVDIQWAHEPAVQGAVLITSSTAEEASVERDDLGGSLFSHFFVSRLSHSKVELNTVNAFLSSCQAVQNPRHAIAAYGVQEFLGVGQKHGLHRSYHYGAAASQEQIL